MLYSSVMHNHGYPTVDPLKRPALRTAGRVCLHNHGYPTVDPLKRHQLHLAIPATTAITTVIRPWTH